MQSVGGITPVTAAKKKNSCIGGVLQALMCKLVVPTVDYYSAHTVRNSMILWFFSLYCACLAKSAHLFVASFLHATVFGLQWWPVCILPQVLVQTLDCWVKMQHTSHGGNAPNCWSSRLNFKPQTKTDGWDMMHVHDLSSMLESGCGMNSCSWSLLAIGKIVRHDETVWNEKDQKVLHTNRQGQLALEILLSAVQRIGFWVLTFCMYICTRCPFERTLSTVSMN